MDTTSYLRLHFGTVAGDEWTMTVRYPKAGLTAQVVTDAMQAVIDADIFADGLTDIVGADIYERTITDIIANGA